MAEHDGDSSHPDDIRIVIDWSDAGYFACESGAVKLDRRLLFSEVRVFIIGHGKLGRRFWLWNRPKAQDCFDSFVAEFRDGDSDDPDGPDRFLASTIAHVVDGFAGLPDPSPYVAKKCRTDR